MFAYNIFDQLNFWMSCFISEWNQFRKSPYFLQVFSAPKLNHLQKNG